jgi:hypothetical protein
MFFDFEGMRMRKFCVLPLIIASLLSIAFAGGEFNAVAPQAKSVSVQTFSMKGKALIQLTLSQPQLVSIRLFNIAGEQMALILNQRFERGVHQVPVLNVPKGFYFVRLYCTGETITKPLAVL